MSPRAQAMAVLLLRRFRDLCLDSMHTPADEGLPKLADLFADVDQFVRLHDEIRALDVERHHRRKTGQA